VIKAVLFDLDGTLVDSAPLWRDALTALVVKQRWRPATAAVEDLAGMTAKDAVATVAVASVGRRLGWRAAELAWSVRWVERQVCARHRGGVAWRDGALELVEAVRAEGARVGLVTSSRRRVVRAVRADRRCPRFDVVVSGDGVRAAKPAPDPYRKAAARLGLDPRVCVAVEDSAVGITSALAAGCAVIAVGAHATGPDQSRILRAGALTDVTVEDVALLAKRAMASGNQLG
jgi:HAD superfamily hydrolase (TIGR01509 family)